MITWPVQMSTVVTHLTGATNAVSLRDTSDLTSHLRVCVRPLDQCLTKPLLSSSNTMLLPQCCLFS